MDIESAEYSVLNNLINGKINDQMRQTSGLS